MITFTYISDAQGIMQGYTTSLAAMIPLVTAYEGEHVEVTQQENDWTVHVKGRFTPIGRIYCMEEAKAPKPPRDEYVKFTVEFLIAPDDMMHRHFHLGGDRETAEQREAGLIRCMAHEIQEAAYDEGQMSGEFKVIAIETGVTSAEFNKDVA